MNEMQINPVFLALTRPPMMAGVTVDYLMTSGIATFVLFMLTHLVSMLVLFVPLYVIGFVMCYQDANQFKVIMTRLNMGFSPLKQLFGCESYAPY